MPSKISDLSSIVTGNFDSLQTSQQVANSNTNCYKLSRGGFVLLAATAGIPLYAIYSFSFSKETVDDHPNWPKWLSEVFEFSLPVDNTMVNRGQSVFGAILSVSGFRKIFSDTTQPAWKKIAYTGGTIILCIPPSMPNIAAAFLAKSDNPLLQWLTRIATPICVLPFNFHLITFQAKTLRA